MPTTIPTLTPLPTIPPEKRGEVYYNLIRSNGGCELPCWWGFDLGKSPVSEVAQFYLSLTNNVSLQRSTNGLSVLYAMFQDPQIEEGRQVRHTFLVKDGIVIDAEIELNVQPEFQIRPILQNLGQPEEVWMWTIPQPYEGILPAAFHLYFPDKGVLIVYATDAVINEDVVQVCFDQPGGVIMLLWGPSIWNPDGTKGFVDRANESSELTLENELPIEEVSNWNTDQFYDFITDPDNLECLQTSSTLWPYP